MWRSSQGSGVLPSPVRRRTTELPTTTTRWEPRWATPFWPAKSRLVLTLVQLRFHFHLIDSPYLRLAKWLSASWWKLDSTQQICQTRVPLTISKKRTRTYPSRSGQTYEKMLELGWRGVENVKDIRRRPVVVWLVASGSWPTLLPKGNQKFCWILINVFNHWHWSELL